MIEVGAVVLRMWLGCLGNRSEGQGNVCQKDKRVDAQVLTDISRHTAFQFSLLFLRKTTSSELLLWHDGIWIVIRAGPTGNIFANKDKCRMWAMNCGLSPKPSYHLGCQTKTHTPNQKPDFYFALSHPDHSMILPEWRRWHQSSALLCLWRSGC